MKAATMPTTIVSQIGMFCFPGATSRPRKPMIAPMTMAVMMPVTVIACSRLSAGPPPQRPVWALGSTV
jgi:hypothetical protein